MSLKPVVTTTPEVDAWDFEDAKASSSRKYALVADETRLKVIIDHIVVIGLEEFKGDNKGKFNYKLGINFTSNVPRTYEDNGEPTGDFHSFYSTYTWSTTTKSSLMVSGLIEALAYDIAAPGAENLKTFIKTVLGKQVSGMVFHTKKEKDGKPVVYMGLQRFKAVTEPEDFTAAVSLWKPARMAVKMHTNKPLITMTDPTVAKPVSSYVNEADLGEAPVVKEIVKLK